MQLNLLRLNPTMAIFAYRLFDHFLYHFITKYIIDNSNSCYSLLKPFYHRLKKGLPSLIFMLLQSKIINKMSSLQQKQEESKQISPIKKLKLTFSSLDENNTGFIEKQVLKAAIMYTGDNYDKEIISNEIQKCDSKISLQKFMQIFRLAQIQINQQLANQSLFKLYDKNNKGFIDKEDLIRVSHISGVELTDQEINQMLLFNTVPGQTQFDEFVEIMNDQNVWF